MTDNPIKLDAEIKAEWVRRLRSGDYVQYKGRLGKTDTNQRCCLGVLADILLEQDKLVPVTMRDLSGQPYDNMAVRDASMTEREAPVADEGAIPTTVALDIGLRQGNPLLPLSAVPEYTTTFANETTVSLAQLNDTGEFDFNRIAELIERHL